MPKNQPALHSPVFSDPKTVFQSDLKRFTKAQNEFQKELEFFGSELNRMINLSVQANFWDLIEPVCVKIEPILLARTFPDLFARLDLSLVPLDRKNRMVLPSRNLRSISDGEKFDAIFQKFGIPKDKNIIRADLAEGFFLLCYRLTSSESPQGTGISIALCYENVAEPWINDTDALRNTTKEKLRKI